MPTISPARTSKAMSDSVSGERVVLGHRQALHRQHRAAQLRLDVLQLRRLGADHQPRQAGVALLRRVDLAGDLAAAQHRAVVAQRADLVELVADVEDGAAFVGQLAQRDEELVDGLRREHRGRLVEDQQLGVGEQRAHDLDALALAHRQRVHRAQCVDVQPVDAGDLVDALGHFGQRQALVQPSQTFSAAVSVSNRLKCW
jgi:hypothetical protein